MAEQENSKDLISVLWSGADVLRSKMDANEYKNYLLGIVFYKYLSDSFLIRVYDLINDEKPESLKVALEAYKNELKGEYANDLLDELKQDRKYVIEPELTYTCFAEDAKNNCFNREQLQKAFNNIEQSGELFVDLFSDIDLYSSRLGAGDQKQSDTIAELIKVIDQADLLNSDGEILGDAYEYLIGQFASETGKKAGEFYTPQAVSKILTRIAITGQENVKGLSIYDPCMGSGSLLLNAKRYYKGDTNYIKYYGQELNMSTYNLARMNMFLHDVGFDKFNIACEDTLISPQHWDDEPFELIVSNPPYSIKWAGDENPLLINDPRFAPAGVLAPKSKADMAFIMHSLSWLASNGTAAIVCFPGIMYRGGAEQKIRKYLVDNNYVDCIIQLPSNLFFGTSIATCIMVMKKNKADNKTLFIDATNECVKVTNNNKLTPEHIEHIVDAFTKREEVKHFAHLASYEEVSSNDYNLSVSTYVEVEDTREKIDIVKLNAEIKEIVAREQVLRDEIDKIIADIEVGYE